MVIKSVGVMSFGKIYGVTCAAVGLLIGLVVAAASSLGGGLAAASGSSAFPFAGIGLAVVIVIPIVYGLFGFIGGLITAALYNVIAGIVGGIEIETTDGAPRTNS